VNENCSPRATCTWSSHSPPPGPSGAAEQKGDLRSLVSCQRGTLLEVARDPRHLGAEIGFFSVLHTWNQKLRLHPHVHCVCRRRSSLDHTRWVRSPDNYFLPKAVLRKVFRASSSRPSGRLPEWGAPLPENLKLLSEPKIFAAWLRPLFRQDWVVYLRRPSVAPNMCCISRRYTHRVAISNHRLVSFADGQVTFRWRDSAHHNEQKLTALSHDKFLRRFLLHLLPQVVRIRPSAFLACRRRSTTLPLCFQLLGAAQEALSEEHTSSTETLAIFIAVQVWRPMKVIERLTAAESSFVLHHGSALRHETALSNSNTPRASARYAPLCLVGKQISSCRLFNNSFHNTVSP